ncbi:MAG TPA: TonB-dependent receptor [Thermoanaerobaculia bacterium]|nr:TonB-dependent receptor [Thermoanaerobaculia bacterium]
MIAIAAVAFLALSAALPAQSILSGNIFGYVTDEQGGRLPGVSVTLTGAGAPQTVTTDSRGEYRFVNVAPGNNYTLTYEIQGFTKVTKTGVQVAVAKNTETSETMKLSKVEAAVTVKGEAATLDTRRVATGATVDQAQLKEIPSARDPWVVLQTIPGVSIDRVNVGGSESGQQSNYVGKGSTAAQNAWNLDGVTITDTAANGSSGTYYDFDSFEEINATTGGSDITAMSPGVQLNLVTKRGTNDIHGSARVFLTPKYWESHNVTAEAIADGYGGGNRIDQIQDYGVEVGGPIIKDRLWAWGAYGRNQIDLLINGSPDRTTLEDKNAKINAQILDGTALTASYTAGDKIKTGRSVGTTRPPETGWNQSGINGKPSELDKIEASQVISSNFFLTASYSYFRGGFQLAPQAGLSVNNVYRDVNQVWHNSYYLYVTHRPQHQAGANGSFFFNTGTLGHELKYGFSYRNTPVESATIWPGNGNYVRVAAGTSGRDEVRFTRQADSIQAVKYYNAWFGDTVTAGNLTFNAGVRYDIQKGNNIGSQAPGNVTIPDLLPGLNGTAGPEEINWKDWSPRLGATYAVGADKKLLLKASYAHFVDQLGSGVVAQDAAGNLTYVGYNLINPYVPNSVVTRDQVDFSRITSSSNYNAANPGSATSINQIAPGVHAPRTNEFVIGADYELLPELVVGMNYTHRKYTDFLDANIPLLTAGRAATAADFVPAGGVTIANTGGAIVTNSNGVFSGFLRDGTPFSATIYRLNPALTYSGGKLLDNNRGYSQNYDGVDLNFQKRLSNHWMVRGSFGWLNWKQKVDAGGCFGVDPSNQRFNNFVSSCVDGEIVAPRSTGSGNKGNIFLNSKWQFNIGGLYQLPMGFNVGANVYGRQGYPEVNTISVNPNDLLGSRLLVVNNVDSIRLKSVFETDVRIEKVINVSSLAIALSVDVFNVTNSGTVLQRQGTVTLNSTGHAIASNQSIQELQAPRTVRAGARLSF